MWKTGKDRKTQWNSCASDGKDLQPFDAPVDEKKNERQPDSGTDDVFVTFVGAHESAHHENESTDKRRICRQAKRAKIKVGEKTGKRVMDKQVKIESERIWEKRKNDQIQGIKRLIQNIGIGVFASLNKWIPGRKRCGKELGRKPLNEGVAATDQLSEWIDGSRMKCPGDDEV